MSLENQKKPLRLLCIGCEVLARPIYLSAAQSPHIVDVEFIKRGLHNHPNDLRALLQDRVNETKSPSYDAILLAYGLCGQATAGLIASSLPVVIPRAHDCITLFLGNRQRYQDQFENHPGTYWYAQDYIEREDSPGSALSMGSGSDTDLQAVYGEYVEKYGKDNADYLMEVMGAWQSHYQRAVYIDMGLGEGAAIEARAQAEAARRGWVYERMAGDMVLIRNLIFGAWLSNADTDFLVLQPGQQVVMSYDENVIGCALPPNSEIH